MYGIVKKGVSKNKQEREGSVVVRVCVLATRRLDSARDGNSDEPIDPTVYCAQPIKTRVRIQLS